MTRNVVPELQYGAVLFRKLASPGIDWVVAACGEWMGAVGYGLVLERWRIAPGLPGEESPNTTGRDAA